MTPAEEAAGLYESHRWANTFAQDVELHFLNGHVMAGPRWFVMFRGVDVRAHRSLIVNPAITFETHNAWHIHVCAGAWIEALASLAPAFPFLPWITWERCDGRLRYYATAKLLAKIGLVRYSSNDQPPGNP